MALANKPACGMFPEPESAYLQGMAYYEEEMKKWEPVAVDESEDEGEDDVPISGQAS